MNHHFDCYFCMVDISKNKKPKDRLTLVYPNMLSPIGPIPHSDELPVPTPHRCHIQSQHALIN